MTNRFDRQQLGETDLLARILNVLVAEFGGATAHPSMVKDLISITATS